MTDLIIHPATKINLESFINRPSQNLILAGPNGSGRRSLAELIITKILGHDIDNYPYIHQIEPIDGAISIEAIRDLRQYLKLKLPVSQAGLRRFVIIEQANLLTRQAQNAILKTLEEPPEDSLILMTCSETSDLLPTIRSRSNIINIQRPSRQQLRDGMPEVTDFDKKYLLSGGLPGLLADMLSDAADADTRLASIADSARSLLSTDVQSRLKQIDSLAKQTADLPPLINMISLMAESAIASSAEHGNSAQIERWHRILKQSHYSLTALGKNGQPKLVLLDYFLNL